MFTQNFGKLEGRVAMPTSFALRFPLLLVIVNLFVEKEMGIWPVFFIDFREREREKY